MLQSGHILQGRYSIISELGRGGMGAVYKAMDLRLNISVALKELTAQSDLDTDTLQDLRDQFRQEATVLARLSHPHLVGVTDFFQEGRNVYLVMQYVEGMSLSDIIKRDGALREDQVLIWSTQLLDALSYCHSQGVIHRDIKPQNIIVNPSGQAVLVDFGLVKLWDPTNPKTRTAVRGIGTPQYAPPEQYESTAGHTEPRSDIFSLGATLYHALTGQSPPTATLRIASPEEFVGVRTIQHSVSVRTASVIERAMELVRTNRWSTAAEMASAMGLKINNWGSPSAVTAVPQLTNRAPESKTQAIGKGLRNTQKRGPVWIWVISIGALVVVIIATVVLISGFIAYDIPAAMMAMLKPATSTIDAQVIPPSSTAVPARSNTLTPTPTNTLETSPTSTDTLEPTQTSTATPTLTPTTEPSSTPTPTATPTNTSEPTVEVIASPTTESTAPGSFTGFETFGSWRRGDEPYGEFVQSSEQFKDGNYSGKLTYDFPDVQNDYVVFTQMINLGGQPDKFIVEVYGDGSGHFLNLWIQDAANEIWSVHLGQIPGTGWHSLTGYLDPNLPWPNGHISGPDNGKVDYPIRFHSIVLDRPNTGPRQGTIYLDTMQAWSSDTQLAPQQLAFQIPKPTKIRTSTVVAILGFVIFIPKKYNHYSS